MLPARLIYRVLLTAACAVCTPITQFFMPHLRTIDLTWGGTPDNGSHWYIIDSRQSEGVIVPVSEAGALAAPFGVDGIRIYNTTAFDKWVLCRKSSDSEERCWMGILSGYTYPEATGLDVMRGDSRQGPRQVVGRCRAHELTTSRISWRSPSEHCEARPSAADTGSLTEIELVCDVERLHAANLTCVVEFNGGLVQEIDVAFTSGTVPRHVQVSVSGNVATCSAKGDPAPSYRWKMEVPDGRPVLVSFTDTVEFVHWGAGVYRCSATNRYAETLSDRVVVWIPTTTVLYIALAVISSAFVGALMSLACVVNRECYSEGGAAEL